MKLFSGFGSFVFGVVALAHLLRAIFAWEVVIEGSVIPMWPSWVGFVVAGILAAGLWREARTV